MKNSMQSTTGYEVTGINIQNEKSLHASIKKWYSQPGDRLEAKVDGYVVDLVRGNRLFEIQTGNFSSISKKLKSLVPNYDVQLVYPISKIKYITKLSTDGEIIHRRKSPKQGNLYDLFDELVGISPLINEEHFSIEVLMIQEEEIRCTDGKGSWRRKGVSIVDRKLIEVFDRIILHTPKDFMIFLPDDLPAPFSNKNLSQRLGLSIYKARKITYCLKKMGLIQEVGKKKNELLFGMTLS